MGKIRRFLGFLSVFFMAGFMTTGAFAANTDCDGKIFCPGIMCSTFNVTSCPTNCSGTTESGPNNNNIITITTKNPTLKSCSQSGSASSGGTGLGGGSMGTGMGGVQTGVACAVTFECTNTITYKCAEKYYGTPTTNNSGCKKCPDNATCVEGATDFTCNTGYYKNADGTGCVSNNNVTTKYCKPGSYMPKGKTDCAACIMGHYCTGGTYVTSPSSDMGLTECPYGFRENDESESMTNISYCQKEVPAGMYLTSTTDGNSTAPCGAGTYSDTHWVQYNAKDPDTCSLCPDPVAGMPAVHDSWKIDGKAEILGGSLIDWESAKGAKGISQCRAMYTVKNDGGVAYLEGIYYNTSSGKYDKDISTKALYYVTINPGFYGKTRFNDTYCNTSTNRMYYQSVVRCEAGYYCPGYKHGTIPLCSSGTYAETLGRNACPSGVNVSTWINETESRTGAWQISQCLDNGVSLASGNCAPDYPATGTGKVRAYYNESSEKYMDGCHMQEYDSCNAGYQMTKNGVYTGVKETYNACTACPKDTYGGGGTSECTKCPPHSNTGGNTGYKQFAQCSCDTGYNSNGTASGQPNPASTSGCEPILYSITLRQNPPGTGMEGSSFIYQRYGVGWYSDALGRTPLPKATIPTYTGYTFTGYRATRSGGTLYIDENGNLPSNTTFTSNTILYAQWKLAEIECKAGQYLPAGKTECEPCPEGSYCPSAGKYTYDPDKDQGQELCPEGQYSDTTGAKSCTNCPAGTYTWYQGTGFACTSCPIGTRSASGASTCTPCGDGMTTSSNRTSASTSCTKCANNNDWAHSWHDVDFDEGLTATSNLCEVISCRAGSYKDGNECIECEKNTTSDDNNESDHCRCEEGYTADGDPDGETEEPSGGYGCAAIRATITLNDNGGQGGDGEILSVYGRSYYKNGQTITKLTPPTRTGHTFKGYYSDINISIKYTDENGNFINGYDTPQATNIQTWYAQWTTNACPKEYPNTDDDTLDDLTKCYKVAEVQCTARDLGDKVSELVCSTIGAKTCFQNTDAMVSCKMYNDGTGECAAGENIACPLEPEYCMRGYYMTENYNCNKCADDIPKDKEGPADKDWTSAAGQVGIDRCYKECNVPCDDIVVPVEHATKCQTNGNATGNWFYGSGECHAGEFATSQCRITSCDCETGYDWDNVACAPHEYEIKLYDNVGQPGTVLQTVYELYNTKWYMKIGGAQTDMAVTIPTQPNQWHEFIGWYDAPTDGTLIIDVDGTPQTNTFVGNALYAHWNVTSVTCPVGTTLVGSTCEPCPTGSYCPDGGENGENAKSCADLDGGKWPNSNAGAESENDCYAVCDASKPTEDGHGTRTPNSATANHPAVCTYTTNCDADYRPSGDRCVWADPNACPVGTYYDRTLESCKSCPPDKDGNNATTADVGATDKTECYIVYPDWVKTPNYDRNFAHGTGTGTCYYETEDYTNCTLDAKTCEAGYWYKSRGAATCEDVDNGYYSPNDATNETECPSGWTGSAQNADNWDKCYMNCELTVDNSRSVTATNSPVSAKNSKAYDECEYTVVCDTGYTFNENKTNPQCVANEYTVTLNKNGGAGNTPESVRCTFDQPCELPETRGLVRAGYKTANQWCQGADGDGACFAAGTSAGVTGNVSADGTDIVLYAAWTPEIYTVTLNDANANVAASPSSVYLKYATGWYQDAYAATSIRRLATKPDKTGYTFAGYNAPNGTTVIDANGEFVSSQAALTAGTGDFIITAQWSAGSTRCDAGKYYVGSGTECAPCEEDHYCGGGYFGTDAGRQGIMECPDGGTAPKNAQSASACAKVVDYTADHGHGTQRCHYDPDTESYSANCSDLTITYCDGGYWFDEHLSTTDCSPVGIGNYSTDGDTNKQECPGNGTTQSATTDDIYDCFRKGEPYDAIYGSGTQRCFYTENQGSDAVYKTRCDSERINNCRGGYWLEDDNAKDCVEVGVDFYSDQGDVERHECPFGGTTGATKDAGTPDACYKAGQEYRAEHGGGDQLCWWNQGDEAYNFSCKAINITYCDGGYYFPRTENAIDCVAVGYNRFSPDKDIDRYDCDAGTFTATTTSVDASECKPCDANHVCSPDLPNGTDTCANLTGGTHTKSDGVADAAFCYKDCDPAPNATAMTGRDYFGADVADTCEISQCATDYALVDGKCVLARCNSGFTLKDGKCVECAPGNYCPQSTDPECTTNGTCSPQLSCAELGDGEWPNSKPGAKTQSECYGACEEFTLVGGVAKPERDTVYYPEQCSFKGFDDDGNPCTIVDNTYCELTACKPAFEMINGKCEPCKRDHALSYKSTGSCLVDKCEAGWHPMGQQCEIDVAECDAPYAVDATRTWDYAKGAYGICIINECQDGYHVASNACAPDVQNCTVEHGTGTREWNHKTNTWSDCVASYCEPGFTNDPYESNEPEQQCGNCRNKFTENGERAASGYSRGCIISSCMYQGEMYNLENNECVPICSVSEYKDETGTMKWNPVTHKCDRTCNDGYVMW